MYALCRHVLTTTTMTTTTTTTTTTTMASKASMYNAHTRVWVNTTMAVQAMPDQCATFTGSYLGHRIHLACLSCRSSGGVGKDPLHTIAAPQLLVNHGTRFPTKCGGWIVLRFVDPRLPGLHSHLLLHAVFTHVRKNSPEESNPRVHVD